MAPKFIRGSSGQALVDGLQADGMDLEEATDIAAQEHGPKRAPAIHAPTIAADYVHTTHPETGIDVVFVPGEALPSWVADVQAEDGQASDEPLELGRPSLKARATQKTQEAAATLQPNQA